LHESEKHQLVDFVSSLLRMAPMPQAWRSESSDLTGHPVIDLRHDAHSLQRTPPGDQLIEQCVDFGVVSRIRLEGGELLPI
jgi:hypothetical protein